SDTEQKSVDQIVTNEAKNAFERDGAVLLKGALHPEYIRLIDLGIERVLKNDSPYKFTFYEGTDGEFIDATRNYDITPEFQRLLRASPIADALGRFMDSKNVWLLFDHVFAKDGGQCNRTPWHQDVPYWPLKGNQLASMWIPIDPLPKEECLEFVARSHKGPMYDGFDPSNNDDPTAPLYGKDYPRLPDIEAERDKWQILAWDMEPGDAIVFHPMALHGGGPTLYGNRRRALSVRCYGDDVVYDTRPDDRATAPPTPGLSLELKPGDPLRSDFYPQLRPSQG
ncbi:MAG: phytanoyl-CoA dioxygenase family protein, partial [Alphaproteobacteria bacterium]|nr:phytanoyl-CoA dioxygenase family protein [Alphaproteobacteria bacterium]